MLFRDLVVGQDFKWNTQDKRTAHVVDLCYGEQPNYVWFIYDNEPNRVYKGQKADIAHQVLTLQKVTKTEKKWVEKKLWGLEGNSKFKFGGYVCTKLINHIERENGSQIIGAVYVDDKHRVKICYDEHQMVLVGEDTVVETEEWLP